MTAILVLLAVVLYSTAVRAQVQFDDVSEDVGLTGFTESWGANFGDLNGDNCLDIYVNGHRDYPRVYRNTCTGEFEDIATEMDDGTWMAIPQDDKHGAAFGDFDNDGDEDIIQSVSVSGDGQLWINQGDGTFVERGSQFGVTSDFAARVAAWMDFTNDGLLDTLQMGLDPRSYTRYQTPLGTFSSAIGTDHECDEGDINFVQLIDLDADGRLELLCIQRGTFPFRAYDTGSLPFLDVTASLPSLGNTNGAILGDANNDLRTDFILTRGATRPAGAAQASNQRVEAWIEKDPGDPPRTGFHFQSGGNITVTNWSRDLSRNAPPHVMNLTFGASQQCSDNSEYRVCAEYNAGQNRWEVWMGGDGGQTYIVVESTQNITGLTNVGQTNRDFPIAARLYLNTPGGFNWDTGSGINTPINCGAGLMADFDNDMDLDIYFTCGAGPENLPNRMYINDGNGNFTLQNNHGAEGPTGIGFDIGVAENTIFGDYDLDGFLDIFVTNGLLYYPWGLGGPDILLRNQGNSNHWIQLDLNGTISNRNGIGAKVYLTAGGVEQLREQNGGYNRWGQNQQWLHFGTGSNMTADIRIEWPSGAVDNHVGVAVDALYEATEGGGLVPKSQGSEVRTVLNPGDECGEPPYDYNFGPANLLWRDCGTDNWHFRSKGGRADPPQLQTRGTIVGDAPFNGVVPFDLQGSDTLDNTPSNEIYFDIRVNGINDQGFDFNTSGQTSACLDFSRLDIETVLIGSKSKKIKTPIDLTTLWECGATPPPEISIANASVDEGAGTVDFTVSLSEVSPVNVTFQVSTQDGTASYLTGDYTQVNSQSHVITAGNLSTTVSVTINDDASAEVDEEFFVSLSNINGARVVGGPATGTIQNNDGPLPELSIADAEALEDTGVMDIVISLNTPAAEVITFSVSTSGQTASYFDGDYEYIIDDFEIPPGDTELVLPLFIGIDDEIEEDEFLFVILDNFSTNVNPVDTQGTATILNDDGDVTPDLSIGDAAVDEDTGALSFTVALSEAHTEDVTFSASTSDGTATTADNDYTALVDAPGVITAGNLSTTVMVSLGVDATPEPDENFSVTLANVSANANLLDGTATGTILDDDTLPGLSIGDAIADEDAGTISFVVSLNEAASGDVTFEAATTDGTATTADNDYTALVAQPGTITAGNLSTLVTVALGVDTDVEPDEQFTVSLGNVSANADLLDGTATGTISNDDSLPDLSIADAAIDEDTGTLSFTVALTQAVGSDVTFDASTADGTATTADNDYIALVNQAGVITAGNLSTTVSVSLGVDTSIEADEEFTVALSNVSANVSLLDGIATGTIFNDDFPLELSIVDAAVNEDVGSLSFTVALNQLATSDVTFMASTVDGTATTSDNDYVALVNEAGTITTGNLATTVTVSIGVDGTVEPNEEFTVMLSNVSANASLVDGVATGTIINDDIPLPDLAIADATVDEDTGLISFTVSLTGPAAGDVTFDATTADGSATTADSDYTALVAQPGTISAGATSTTVNVSIGIDAVVEANEDFTVTLANVSPNANLVDGIATGTINNDDALPLLSIADTSADEDTGSLEFTVSLDKVAAGDVTFGATTVDGTATTADGDYTALIDELGTITAGNLSTTVTVAIGVDAAVEGDEEMVVTLANVSANAELLDGVATGTIVNDDVPSGPTIVDIDSWLGHLGGVTTVGNQVVFDGNAGNAWNNTAFSVPLADFGFSDDFELRFTISGNPNNSIWAVGLGISESESSYRDIDYALRSSNGQLTIYENGGWQSSGPALSDGDEISIFVSGGAIEYRHNGSPVFTSSYSGSPDWYVDTGFKQGAVALDVVVEGDAGPVEPPDNLPITNWLNQSGGVTATGNNLSFSGTPSNWTNSINSVSMSSLGAGSDYTVSWTIDSNPAGTIWVVGLGVTESNTQRTDVDYGFRSSNGTLQVRMNGNWLTSVGALSTGDVLAIHVSGTTLEFMLNGVAVYSTAISGTESFYIDSAFKSGAIDLGSFTLTE